MVRIVAKFTVLRLAVQRSQEIRQGLHGEILQGNGGESRFLTELHISVIGAQSGPVMVGVKVQILIPVFAQRVIDVDSGNPILQTVINVVDVGFLGLGDALVPLRQSELHMGGNHHVVNLHRIPQSLMVGVDGIRVGVGHAHIAAHSKGGQALPFVDEQIPFPFALCPVIRNGWRAGGILLLTRRRNRRQLLRLAAGGISAVNPKVIHTDAFHLIHSGGKTD